MAVYTFDFDERALTLHIQAKGVWSFTTLAAFSASALMHGAALKLRHRRFAILCDVREFPVQPSEIAAGIERLMGKASGMIAAPMAVVTGSHLSRMQAERVLKGEWTQVFMDMDHAQRWLEETWQGRRAA